MMNPAKWFVNFRAGILVMLFSAVALFQNCGKFQVETPPTSPADLSATGVSLTGLKVELPDGSLLPEGRFIPQAMYVYVSIDPLHSSAEVNPSDVSWSHTTASGSLCLTRLDDANRYEVRCDEAGTLEVTARVKGLSKVFGLKRTVKSQQEDPPEVPHLVLFRVRAGTQAKAWNSPLAPLELYVGQTLRFINEDNVPHQLATSRGAPCPSASAAMESSEYFDCLISKETASEDAIYDNIYGRSAQIHLKSIDGAVRYTQYCSGCHNSLAASFKKGRSFQQIKAAIFGDSVSSAVREMDGLKFLSDQDIRAVAFSLK